MKILSDDQDSKEWHEARHGRITGTSLFGAIGGVGPQNTLMYRVVAARMTPLNIFDLMTDAVVRGKELEPVALEKASKRIGIKFTTTGFLLSDCIEDFGFSPDGVQVKDGQLIGGIEIKCPGSKKHVEYIIRNQVPPEYDAQVLSPFIAYDSVDYWYFVSYDDRNKYRKLFIKKVFRHEVEEKIETNRKALRSFVVKCKEAYEKLVGKDKEWKLRK